ncbi:hypothetical protein AAC387_Pa11g0082 [Persea americana]
MAVAGAGAGLSSVLKNLQSKLSSPVLDGFGRLSFGKKDKLTLEKSAVGAYVYHPSNSSSDLLQTQLQEKLHGKRYLLLLDGVRNEERYKWNRLKACLKCGAMGSRILVTTRSDTVASIMGTLPRHDLGRLSEEQSWSLFQKLAKPLPDFLSIGKEMVDRCGGDALAVKTLGGLMFTKTTKEEWESVRSSDFWKPQGLDNIGNGVCAREANLKGKQHLHSLELSWPSVEAVAGTRRKAEEVIENLKPQSNPKKLVVENYLGLSLPSWMMMLSNLVDIKLSHCNGCEHLLPLGQLCFLESLKIEEMSAVKYVVEFDGSHNYEASLVSLDETLNETHFPGVSSPTSSRLLSSSVPNVNIIGETVLVVESYLVPTRNPCSLLSLLSLLSGSEKFVKGDVAG